MKFYGRLRKGLFFKLPKRSLPGKNLFLYVCPRPHPLQQLPWQLHKCDSATSAERPPYTRLGLDFRLPHQGCVAGRKTYFLTWFKVKSLKLFRGLCLDKGNSYLRGFRDFSYTKQQQQQQQYNPKNKNLYLQSWQNKTDKIEIKAIAPKRISCCRNSLCILKVTQSVFSNSNASCFFSAINTLLRMHPN